MIRSKLRHHQRHEHPGTAPLLSAVHEGATGLDGAESLSYGERVKVWVRKCASFEEEAVADREFWRSMSPDERVMAVEQVRLAGALNGRRVEGFRRVVRVLGPPRG